MLVPHLIGTLQPENGCVDLEPLPRVVVSAHYTGTGLPVSFLLMVQVSVSKGHK